MSEEGNDHLHRRIASLDKPASEPTSSAAIQKLAQAISDLAYYCKTTFKAIKAAIRSLNEKQNSMQIQLERMSRKISALEASQSQAPTAVPQDEIPPAKRRFGRVAYIGLFMLCIGALALGAYWYGKSESSTPKGKFDYHNSTWPVGGAH